MRQRITRSGGNRDRAPSATRPAVPTQRPAEGRAAAAPLRAGHAFGNLRVFSGFPHGDAIHRLTGREVPGRAIHDPSLRRRLGVEAVAAGATAVFDSPAPHPRMAAHEAAHLMQHAGATRDQWLGPEGHADAVAGEVAAGRTATHLLGRDGSPVPPAVRPYT